MLACLRDDVRGEVDADRGESGVGQRLDLVGTSAPALQHASARRQMLAGHD